MLDYKNLIIDNYSKFLDNDKEFICILVGYDPKLTKMSLFKWLVVNTNVYEAMITWEWMKNQLEIYVHEKFNYL